MSSKKGRKKRKSRKAKKSGAVSQRKGVSNPGGAPAFKKGASAKPGPAGEINRLISKGDVKSAVNRAKQFHKVTGTGASEAILVDAYIARILEMNEKGLTVEADALLELVRERYHLPVSRLLEIETAAAARGGINDEFLAPLDDSATPPDRLVAIQNVIKEKVVDLTTLTASKTLASQHPLKVQAVALKNAFEAVTSGPVRQEEIALPGIPRRSPLAPWKMLIKALFFFYRREDTLCEKALKGVESGSAPARLVSVIHAMVQEKRFGTPGENAHALVEQVTGNRRELLKRLRDLDAVLDAGDNRKLSPAIRNVISCFGKFRPELIEGLKQGISIRSWMMGANEKQVQKAMGGPSLKNARFWNFFALAAEIKGEDFLACALWNEFIKHAVHERIFSENSLESSVVYFHGANLLAEMGDAHFEWSRSRFEDDFRRSNGLAGYYEGQTESIMAAGGRRRKTERHPWFFYPERLYGRVCEIAPFSEAYGNWLEWIQNGNFNKKRADEVAVSWHKAIPQNITPVLHLAESAERRNAFKKCMTYLDEAERIDALHPAIKKIRLRILSATAIRHLKQKKTHLAKKDFREMEALPLFQVGDRPLFLTALKWVCALIDGSERKSRVLYDELLGGMEGELAAMMISRELLNACGVSPKIPFGANEALNMDELPSHIGRACLLGDDVGLPMSIPPICAEELEDVFTMGTPSLDAPAINAIGAAALREDFTELAYVVSGAGLLKGGPTVARSLLLRAGSLPFSERFRKKRCIDAAIALAQRERDMDLIAEAIELRRNVAVGGFLSHLTGIGEGQSVFSTDPEALAAFLDSERAAREYPDGASDLDFPDDDDDEDFETHDCQHCDAEDCPGRKVAYVSGFDDVHGKENDPDDDAPWDEQDLEIPGSLLEDDLFDLPVDLPPEAVPIMMEMMLKFGNKGGELPELDEVFHKDPELGERLLKILPDLIEFPELEEKGKKRKGKR